MQRGDGMIYYKHWKKENVNGDYPAKLLFTFEGEINTPHDKQILKGLLRTKLQKILKEVLHTEGKDKCKQENSGKNKSY
jgi:hypothetical protein